MAGATTSTASTGGNWNQANNGSGGVEYADLVDVLSRASDYYGGPGIGHTLLRPVNSFYGGGTASRSMIRTSQGNLPYVRMYISILLWLSYIGLLSSGALESQCRSGLLLSYPTTYNITSI